MSDFSMKERLEGLKPGELIDLIMALIQKGDQSRLYALEWLEKNNGISMKSVSSKKRKENSSIHEELLFEYWGKAQRIISDFNRYGGGPEDDEEEAYEWLEDISNLLKEHPISSLAKYKLLDAAFVEYNDNNSGFEDGLTDIFFELCSEKEEWEYLVNKLNQDPTDWRKGLIMNIYKGFLNDDAKYLDVRLKNLKYGMDYWDLVQFYFGNSQNDLALETALKGVEIGEGRLTELYDYLIDYYSEMQDGSGLEKVAKVAVKRKNNEKYVFDRLFEYYKTRDYDKAKEKLLQSYKQGDFIKYFEEYMRMKSFLSEVDWNQIEPEIEAAAQSKNLQAYMDICFYKGLKEPVIKIIVDPPKNQWGFSAYSDLDTFAEKLEKDYPNEILDYYYKKAYRKIPNGNRGTYREAACYLEKIKEICIMRLNDTDKWVRMLNSLLGEFRNRPAFIDEIKKIKI